MSIEKRPVTPNIPFTGPVELPVRPDLSGELSPTVLFSQAHMLLETYGRPAVDVAVIKKSSYGRIDTDETDIQKIEIRTSFLGIPVLMRVSGNPEKNYEAGIKFSILRQRPDVARIDFSEKGQAEVIHHDNGDVMILPNLPSEHPDMKIDSAYEHGKNAYKTAIFEDVVLKKTPEGMKKLDATELKTASVTLDFIQRACEKLTSHE